MMVLLQHSWCHHIAIPREGNKTFRCREETGCSCIHFWWPWGLPFGPCFIHHALVPTWSSRQSIGGLMMHQVLLQTSACSLFGHPILWVLKEDLHPVWSDTSSYLSKHFSFYKKNECMHGQTYSHQQSSVWCLLENALNDKGCHSTCSVTTYTGVTARTTVGPKSESTSLHHRRT